MLFCPGMPTQTRGWDQGPSSHPGLCGTWYMCASNFWHDLLMLPIHQTVKDAFHWLVNCVCILRWLYKQTVGVRHLRFSLKLTLILWSCLLRHWSQYVHAIASEKHTVDVVCHDPENNGVKWSVCPSIRWNLNHICGCYSILYYGEISKCSYTGHIMMWLYVLDRYEYRRMKKRIIDIFLWQIPSCHISSSQLIGTMLAKTQTQEWPSWVKLHGVHVAPSRNTSQ